MNRNQTSPGLPDFVVCGVQKGGTTFLYRLLDDHPDVCMSSMKEVHFFDRDENFSRGIPWYSKRFDHCEAGMLLGEATPHYYRFPRVPGRMADVIPGARLIFLLRDPVRRAYSNYWFNVSRGAESRGFLEALETRDGYHRYVEKGFYVDFLENFLVHFERERLCVLLLGDLREGNRRGIRKLEDFLELSSSSLERVRNDQQPANVTRVPRRTFWRLLVRLYSRVQRAIPSPVKRWSSGLRRLLKRLITEPEYPPMEDGVDRYLRHVYLPYNRRLERFLERDLSRWYR